MYTLNTSNVFFFFLTVVRRGKIFSAHFEYNKMLFLLLTWILIF